MKMKLRLWRMRRGMTREQLALAAGLTEQTILRIENKGVLPHPGTIKKLADALQVNAEELLVEEDEEKLAKVG